MINLRKILDINNRKGEKNEFTFELYFAGDTPISLKAASNAKAIFDKYCKNNYTMHSFDINKNTALVERENIIAVPLLVRKSPLPEIRMIGDFSDMQKVKNEFLIR
jgi:circadian clock protein KaiB